MSLPTLPQARALIAEVVHDDISDAGPDDDLRDYGLDSIRLHTIVDTLYARGIRVRPEDLAGTPTLRALATALMAAPITDPPAAEENR